MGQVSKIHVPYGTDVVIPMYKHGEISDDCTPYEVCHCSHTGKFSKACEPTECRQLENCRMDDTLKSRCHHCAGLPADLVTRTCTSNEFKV